MEREIDVSANMDDLLYQAAQRITAAAERAVRERGEFSFVLSGGHTPQGLYMLLAREPYRLLVDWKKVSVYFGDERCVAPDSDQSNFRMANESLLSKAPIPPERIFRMRGEIDPQEAAKEYGELLKSRFGEKGPDMILLGMGDDGHTASLFPGAEALRERKHRCVATHVEKLNAWRITMTAPFINRAAAVMIMVAGRGKASRVKEVLEGPSDPERLPIQMIQPESGTLTWLLDAGAAGMFEEE
ncbi:MAG TPA: 6-phosphogluconolactonase [Tepidisphaeraceae bacterium]|jgi:6-phosphogluconolactonase|nr:6-phosphogluconolactonase [Tepidisphaeraceae bacterium]